MNYCTKCESYYQKPRTCNCFAAQGESQPWTVPLGDPTLAPLCGSCGCWHVTGPCPNTTIRPPGFGTQTTCSTVRITGTQMAEDLRTGRATYTEAN